MQKRHKVAKAPVMAWMLVNPQIHNIFASLGVHHGDAYKVSEDCLAILGDILSKLSVEDRSLRTFRRAIGFGQHIRKDLLPLLIHVKDDTKTKDATKIIDATIKILVNLTIPVECLLSMDALSKTDVGRHTIFEINKLLYSSKEAFIDSRSIKAVMDHMKFVIERGTKLEMEQCDSINNCLLLLRNILHIPENRMQISNCPLAHSSMQNRILWNLFTQSIDKLLLHLMSFPQKIYWVVTMVQLIALMYKDQHVGTLQKLLNLWFEASLSESSDDNESNTSPPNQGSGDSSPMLTSDPTSDSSDNGGSGKCNGDKLNTSTDVKQHVVRSSQNRNKVLLTSQKHPQQQHHHHQQQRPSDADSSISSLTTDSKMEEECHTRHQQAAAVDNTTSPYPNSNSFRANKRKLSQAAHRSEHGHLSGAVSTASTSQSEGNSAIVNKKTDSQHLQSELSDYGYGTQVENQESISTSSNDDETPQQKPVHQKPHMILKARYNNSKNRNVSPQDKKEERRKKLIKRSKINIINMKGLMHHSPTDEDISNILKEFTVDFLLKGYGSLVHELYVQLLSNVQIQIDTSHFFWLVTYFLKFATQLELEFELIEPVLSFNIISYLTYEGVNLCEQLEINSNQSGTDLKPCLRRMHLVVTAIREFLQAIETYKKITHLTKDNHECLLRLQIQIASTENLKCLLLLLIRQYNAQVQSRQYLQDLLVTNHILLLFLDSTLKLPEYTGTNTMVDHLKQFASVEVMHQYGILLENFENNGKFTNDCIFTMMHHIGGDIDNVATLFQPNILKTFSKIWESDYEICDDWSDLIEYVIHKFINVPRQPTQQTVTPTVREPIGQLLHSAASSSATPAEKEEVWPEEDFDALYWYHVQSRKRDNVIENIEKLYIENGVTNHTRTGIIQQLLKQNMISQNYYEEYMKTENIGKDSHHPEPQCFNTTEQENQEFRDIQALKEQLVKEHRGKAILWLQQILLESCHCKVIVHNEVDVKAGGVFEPVPYCYIKLNQSIPIIPWSKEHNTILHNQSFILLLHKLGFHLPEDTRKLFIRIPNFWTADYMYSIAQKLGPIDPDTLKFDINLLKTSDNIELAADEDTLDVRIARDNSKVDEPSTSQYTPLPNSPSNWLQTVLHSKVTAMLDLSQDITSSDALSITVPEVKPLPVNLSSPKISVVPTTENLNLLPPTSTTTTTLATSVDNTSNTMEQSHHGDEFEHNSICDTASVASDLTRMYVSDEEEKQ